MLIGLCTHTHAPWLEEFKKACQILGHEYRLIKVGQDDWLDQIHGIDAFVWRVIMGDPSCMAEAHIKIPLIEEMGIPCFPNRQMLWLFDDKIRESLFFRKNNYPTPATWIFFDEAAARAHAAKADYPLVVKSHCGASSVGVAMLRSRKEADHLLDQTFHGHSLWKRIVSRFYITPRLKRGNLLLALRYHFQDSWPRYAYFQEFVQTDCDWRITTLGSDLVSVFVRRNRPKDFRASGSGLWEKVALEDLPTEACDLALHISNTHGFTSMTYDFMKHGDRWVMGEMSYSFLLNDIYTQTLFRRDSGSYLPAAPIPVGVMHLCALLHLPFPGDSSTPASTRSAHVG